MSKKKRKNKKRRILKHSEAASGATRQVRRQEEEKPTAVLDVRPDLKKTALLTVVCLGVLLALFLTQSRWPLPF